MTVRRVDERLAVLAIAFHIAPPWSHVKERSIKSLSIDPWHSVQDARTHALFAAIEKYFEGESFLSRHRHGVLAIAAASFSNRSHAACA